MTENLYYNEQQLIEACDIIVDDLSKIGLEETDRYIDEMENGSSICLVELNSEGDVYTITARSDYYGLYLSYEYSIAREIGLEIPEESESELISNLPEDFPINPDTHPTTAAGLVPLANMDSNEKSELGYQLLEAIRTPHTTWGWETYRDVPYNFRVTGIIFPSSDSHSIQDTASKLTAVTTAAQSGELFINYAFSDLNNGSLIEDALSGEESPLSKE